MATFTPDEEELAVLFHAALLGRTDVLTKVISDVRNRPSSPEEIAKFISTTRVDDGCTALHIAAACGHSDVLRALLQNGIDVSIVAIAGDYEGKTAYELANDSTRKTFHVSLFEQVALGNIPSIIRLLSGGVPVDIKDGSKTNDTPIHWASSFGNIEVVEQLFTHGCDVNTINDLSQSALHYACKANNEILVKLLLDEGADVGIIDTFGKKAEELTNNEHIVEIIHNRGEPSYTFKNIFIEKSKAKIIIKKEEEEKEKEERQRQLLQHQYSHHFHIDQDNKSSESMNKDRFHSLSDVFHETTEMSTQLDRPLLVLWPPPQRQRFLYGPNFELSTSSNLLICVVDSQIDIFPLMTWSGLMDVLDRLGFQAQAKRSIAGSKICLSIDKYICPGSEKYQIIITSERVTITASDSVALLYAVQTFVQIIQLQSLIKSNHGITSITIPAIEINDWADIPTRGVLWCYRGNARMVSSQMRESVELLSKLRINTVFLAIDTDDIASSVQNGTTVENAPTTKIYALDEVCKRNHINLIPTIIVNSIKQTLPTEASKNFSQTMISIYILFDYDSIQYELKKKSDTTKDTMVSKEDILSAAYDSCESLLSGIQSVGFRTVMIVSCQWVQDHIDPSRIASRLGLHVQNKMLNDILPNKLFMKSIVDMKQYVESIMIYLSDVTRVNCDLAILPAFIDNDFLYPSLLTKFYCFLYGGLSWNRSSGADIMNINTKLISSTDSTSSSPIKTQYIVPDYYGHHIRQAIKYFLLPSTPGIIQSSETVVTILLDILSGNIQSLVDPNDSSHVPNSQPLTMSAFFFSSYVPPPIVSMEEGVKLDDSSSTAKTLYSSEAKLWPITTSMSYISYGIIPSKAETSKCLRVYRRIINSALWKPSLGANKILSDMNDNGASVRTSKLISALDSLEHSLDVEEFLSVIHLFSIISKAIIFSHNVYEKASTPRNGKQSSNVNSTNSSNVNSSNVNTNITSTSSSSTMTLKILIGLLPPGTKSDLANSLLEIIEHLSIIWRKKYDRMNTGNNIPSDSLAEQWLMNRLENNQSEVSEDQILTYIRANFLMNRGHNIPASPIFKLMTQGLVMPKSIEDVLKHLFD